jgi:hypothetical protein
MSNPVRKCLGCAVEDDHPRHVIDLDGVHSSNWHPDCHARITGCEDCALLVKGAKDKTGDYLRAYIIEKG